MELRHIYLTLTVLGSVLPLYFLVQFFAQHGIDLPLFLAQLFVNPISSFFAMDVLVSGVLTVVFIATESRRLRIQAGLWCVLGLSVGVSLALPVFLYVRQRKLDRLT